ncbi:hypothetical protein SAMN04487886_11338 [Clostridium sp. DSM 8431]|uniref:hypothetical protein n=1 Tax=Clostridium sp. DSM 8431 TaxID=1761781 RepID=UPI0008EBA89E|nr:hypothetical protein [Clostridium sp. DSM 8431]SFU74896.1 hypothetical protein SAMN04487886_11338 [Clostridium sp. DSM 8431]
MLLGTISFIFIGCNKEIKDIEIIGLSTAIILCAVYFLPHMHERYSFLGEILLILYYVLKRKKIYIPLLLMIGISNSYITFLTGGGFIDIKVCSLIMLFIIVVFSVNLIKEYLDLEKII